MSTKTVETLGIDLFARQVPAAQRQRLELQRLAHRAAFLAQYYKDGYREENMFEVGSTTAHGSRGSVGSQQSIVLGINICNTVYFA